MIVKELKVFLRQFPDDVTVDVGWEGTIHDIKPEYFWYFKCDKILSLDAEDGYAFAKRLRERAERKKI